jgi:hypothetical protein
VPAEGHRVVVDLAPYEIATIQVELALDAR